MRAGASRSEAIDRGRSEACRVAVRASADGRLLQIQPEQLSGATRELPQCAVARRALQRLVEQPILQPDLDAGCDRLDRLDGGAYLEGVRCVKGSDIDVGGAISRHDVGPVAARDHSHVDRDAALRVVEGVHPLYDVGELEHRARSFLGFHPGVGRYTKNPKLKMPDAFSGRLDHPRRSLCRFQDQGAVRGAGEPCDVPRRGGTPHLLIGVHEHHRRHDGLDPEIVKCLQGVDDQHQAALHVVDPRPAQPAVLQPNRHVANRAERPNRIVVAYQQLGRSVPRAADRPGHQMVTLPASRHEVDIATGLDQPLRQEALDLGMHVGSIGGRLRQGESAEEVDHLLTPSLEIGAHGWGRLAGGGHGHGRPSSSQSSARMRLPT